MSEVIIQGRPDMRNRSFGVTYAKRFPPYIFSTNANGCLIHRVKNVQLRWYEVASRDTLRWLNNPSINIKTVCQQILFIRTKDNRRHAQMCQLPSSDAVMCGRCEGKGSTFGKGVDSYALRKEAHQKLGCLIEGDE